MDFDIVASVHSTTKLFLTGPFGAGKTTLAVERVRWLLRQERVRGDDILILAPQRTLAEPYYASLQGGDSPPGSPVRITTFASLAQQAVQLYWPLLAQTAGFTDPSREPTFLTLETSQYHMAQLVDAAIDQGEFEAVHIERGRVISQILDNLNKAALLGLNIDATYQRLELAIPAGEQRTARLNALRAAQRISHAFRQLCLHTTLLDFSLQVVLFNEQIMRNEWSRTHLLRSHRHLVFDNAEEDTPSAQRLVHAWLPQLASALIVADEDAGYRTFLGADPGGIDELAAACAQRVAVRGSFHTTPELSALEGKVIRAVGARPQLEPNVSTATVTLAPTGAPTPETPTPETPTPETPTPETPTPETPTPETPTPGTTTPATVSPLVIPPTTFRFYPQMIAWATSEIRRLVVEEGIPPSEIVLLAPFVSDALRFSLQTALAAHNIGLATHRPSRALETEPAARTLLALARLAHPHWGMLPAPADVAHLLAVAIPQLDPVRAHLLAEIVYPPRRRTNELGTFAALNEAMRARVTYAGGEDYDKLRTWLYAYRASPEVTPLDQFFARLFGEVLSQPGFGFHADRDAARIASQLVESARKFRWAMTGQENQGRSYVELAEAGAIGALYVPGWRAAEDAVFLAPAYTFLLRNRPATIQFWLDIGASGWWERLYQPLTHPYVLSQRWPPTEPWTDAAEYNTRQDTLRRLLLGLIRRTRQAIYLGVSDFSESGYEQRGPLLMLVNRLLTQQ